MQIVSLAGREAEIAIRMSRPEGNSLVARKLPGIRLGLFATVEIDLRQERLIEIPLPITIPARSPWIVCHTDTRRLPNVAKVYGWVVEAFKRIDDVRKERN